MNVTTVLSVAGRWHLEDQTTQWALLSICIILTLTLLAICYLTQRLDSFRK
jgi:hypothetical protein